MERKSMTVFARRSSSKRVQKGRARSMIIGELARESEMIEVRSGLGGIMKPMNDNPMFVRKFRFRRSAAGAAVVTASSLVNVMAVAIGSTTFRRLFGSVRLLKVELWTSVLANANGANNASLEFFPNVGSDVFDQGPPQCFEAVSSGSSVPGHLHIRPGVLCKIGRPINASLAANDALFRTLGNPGDLIEITIECSLLNTALVTGPSLTGSGGTAGYVFENTYLDNTSTSGTSGTQILNTLTPFAQAVVIG